jgi:NitT/TauT family transport system substrate-binding protein
MMFRRHFAAAATLVLLAPTMAIAAEPVTIGWGAFPDVPQIAHAQVKNLWATEGLSAKIVPFATGRAGFEALVGGQLDYVVMTEFPAVTGVMRGLKFAVVGVLSQYKSFRVITKAGPGVSGLTTLAGKKVAVPVGTNVHFIVADALDKAGVKAELVNVPPPEMVAALSRGDVDAIMSFPSGYGKARAVLGASYGEIALPGYASSFVLAASEKAMTNQALTRKVLATLLKGQALVDKDAAESQQVTAKYVGGALTAQALQASWADYEYQVKLDSGTLDLMVREGQWLRAKGFVKQGDPTAALYRRWFQPEPLASLDSARVKLP